MTIVDVVGLIGLTHLLQPPLTVYLAGPRGLNLKGAISSTTPLGAVVLHNMAFASIGLPTALGILLTVHARELSEPGAARSLALLLAGFWSWRLYRQLTALRRHWPEGPRQLRRAQVLLSMIFFVQGPLLALCTGSMSAR
jgi:hypothetical protein